MVLIALAIVFAGLGAMSLTKSESRGADSTSQAAHAGPGRTSTAARPSTATAALAPSPAAPAAIPSPTATVDKSLPVRVLNNGTVAGLAARTSGQLSASGWNIAETGNYSDSVVAKSTAYYSTPQEQAAAQAIASELGIVAQPRFPEIADSPPGVIVIVTGN